MIPMASWAPEFCTVCYKQCILGTVYCSDQCRQADCQKSRTQGSVMSSSTSVGANEQEATDSSDEDDEVPNLWLAQNSNPPEQKNSVGKSLRSQMAKKKDTQFLYASPKLNPSKASEVSLAMSPLLIPKTTAAHGSAGGDHMSAQSVSTYRRWLSHGAA